MPLLFAAVPPAPPSYSDKKPPTSQPSANASIGPQGFVADVTSTSQVGGTVPFRRAVKVPVPVMCWMAAGPTGAQYAADWGPGGPFYNANGGESGYAYIRSTFPDFMDYADKDGHWYISTCRTGAPPAVVVEYQRTHPPRFVETGQPPPPVEPHVDPEVLMHAARDSMVLPTGTIRWNPSLPGTGATVVNIPTFVWVENSTDAVQVRAEILETGTWAQIDATLAGLDLEAPGGEQDAPCLDNGTPYTPGMTSSTCSITFWRSTANQKAKDKDTPPTVTLTATARWTATWTSSLNPNPQALEVPPTTTTAEVPVAEIQTIVTR